MSAEIIIRPFADDDASQVRELFITVNRLLSPPDLRDAFEAYIERALAEEIDRIPTYYVPNGNQSGPRIGVEKGPLTGVGAGLSR